VINKWGEGGKGAAPFLRWGRKTKAAAAPCPQPPQWGPGGKDRKNIYIFGFQYFYIENSKGGLPPKRFGA